MARVLIFLFSFLILTKFNIDPDLGWHLAYGGHFLETGQIFRADTFSWTMPGYEWGNSYFAFQILTAWLFGHFGYIFSVVFFGFVCALGIFILVPKKLNIWSVLYVGLGCFLLLPNSGIRPHGVDFPFVALLLVLVSRKKFKQRQFVPFWFLFFALWANFHVGFVLGLLILMAMVVFDLMPRLKTAGAGEILLSALVILVSFLGTLFTPFHVLMWKSIFLDSAGLTGWDNIAALQPTVIYTPYNLFLAISGAIFLFFLRKKPQIISAPLWIVSSFIFLLGFFVVDFLYFWGLFFIFLSTRYFKINLLGDVNLFTKFPLLFCVFVVYLVFGLNFLANMLESWDLNKRFVMDGYPVSALDYIVQNNLTENLFNDYGWGGYLIWREPSVKVFIDGRFAGWRKNDRSGFLADYLKIRDGKCEVLANYQVKTVLVTKVFNTECFRDFNLVYEDSTAKVLTKSEKF